MKPIDTTILASNYHLFYQLFFFLISLVILSIVGWFILKFNKNNQSKIPIAFTKSISFLIMLRGIAWVAISYIIIKISLIIELKILLFFGILTGILLGLGEIILAAGLFAQKIWAEKAFHKVKHFILGPISDKIEIRPNNSKESQ